MITCTVDYDRDNNVTVMLTDTTYSGAFMRVDSCEGITSFIVRYDNGKTVSGNANESDYTCASYTKIDALIDACNSAVDCIASRAYNPAEYHDCRRSLFDAINAELAHHGLI